MSTKKHLALLPEMLPAPPRAGETTSSVRNRTMARLKVLAAFSAVGIASACGGKSDNSGNGGVDGLPDDGGVGNGEDAYGVVDPLPAPACFERTPRPTATAQYVSASDGGADAEAGAFDAGAGRRLVEVDLSWSLRGIVVGELTSYDGVKLVESSSAANGARLVVAVPDSYVAPITARLQISCSTGPSSLLLTFTLGPNIVTVTVEESDR